MSKEDSGQTVPKSIVDETLAEHRDAMHVVTSMENCLDRHPDREGGWIGQIREELPRLAETLRHHFEVESRGPLYRQLPQSHPRFADRLERLESEHESILTTVAEVTQKADALRDPPLYAIREFNAAMQLLVATIRRHEAEENEIILSAHWDEVGAGD